MRVPGKLPSAEGWVEERVKYCPHDGYRAEFGTVTRMATGKLPAAFVLFDGEDEAKYCYLKDLEILT